jgi:hypothetical protein
MTFPAARKATTVRNYLKEACELESERRPSPWPTHVVKVLAIAVILSDKHAGAHDRNGCLQ